MGGCPCCGRSHAILDGTLAALVASGNVDWRVICFPVGFQAIESFWVVIQSFRKFFKIFNAEQLTAEPRVPACIADVWDLFEIHEGDLIPLS